MCSGYGGRPAQAPVLDFRDEVVARPKDAGLARSFNDRIAAIARRNKVVRESDYPIARGNLSMGHQ